MESRSVLEKISHFSAAISSRHTRAALVFNYASHFHYQAAQFNLLSGVNPPFLRLSMPRPADLSRNYYRISFSRCVPRLSSCVDVENKLLFAPWPAGKHVVDPTFIFGKPLVHSARQLSSHRNTISRLNTAPRHVPLFQRK